MGLRGRTFSLGEQVWQRCFGCVGEDEEYSVGDRQEEHCSRQPCSYIEDIILCVCFVVSTKNLTEKQPEDILNT